MGILLVYDVTDETSFNNIRNWMRNIEQHASDNVNKVRPHSPDPYSAKPEDADWMRICVLNSNRAACLLTSVNSVQKALTGLALWGRWGTGCRVWSHVWDVVRSVGGTRGGPLVQCSRGREPQKLSNEDVVDLM